MIPVIFIRPEPGCSASIAAAKAMGIETVGFPLFHIAPLQWEAPPAEKVDALLLGSANAVRQAGPQLGAFAGFPAYAVGEQTAQAAANAGLVIAMVGTGGLQEIVPFIASGHRRLLRITGERHVTLNTPDWLSIDTRIAYSSEAVPLPEGLAELLAAPAFVALHSAEAARHFRAECDRLAIQRSVISIAALGPRIADAAGCGWARIAIAAQPSDTALLALADRLCQGSPD